MFIEILIEDIYSAHALTYFCPPHTHRRSLPAAPLRSGRRHGRQLQLHGGMPVYLNGSPGDEHAVGIYFCAKAGQWHVLTPYTEEGAAATAACATIAPASGNLTVPMGTSRAQVFDGQAWQARDVRIDRAGGFLGGCCASARAPAPP